VIYDLLAEMGHYAGALPLLVCVLVALARKEDPPPAAWLLSAAFFVSYVADTIAAPLGARHLNTWWLGYLYAPLQMGLFAMVVAQHRAVRSVTVTALLLMALVSALRGTLAAPETMVQVVGALAIAWLAWGSDALGRYRAPVLLYCVAGAPLLLLMGVIDINARAWLYVWAGYQVVRVVALGWMTWALVRKEVSYGPRKCEDRGPEVLRELGTWVPDLGRRSVPAQASKR
jgi:hypothetical protein